MALSNLFGWRKKAETEVSAACGTAGGASDKPEEKPAACGTACGASDKQNKLRKELDRMSQYFSFQWHITDECDQRCKHCYIFSGEGCKEFEPLPVKQTIEKI